MPRTFTALAVAALLAVTSCEEVDASRYAGDMCVDDLPGGKVCGYTVTEICEKADGVTLARSDGIFCMIDGELWELT